MRIFLFLSAVSTAFLPVSCGGDGGPGANKIINFTAIPGDNTDRLKEKFAPLEKYLSEKLGVTVKYVPTTSYSASVEAFVNGDVHLAWFGGLTGVRARLKVEGAEAIAQGKADPNYHSYFIAHKGSGLEKSGDFPKGIEGKTFTFGSESSTSGRLMPEHFIREHTGKAPAEYLAGDEMSFSGSHEKTAKLVESGTFEAGAIDYKTYDRLVKEKKIDPEKCYVIWTTPPYPDYNWTAHPDLETTIGKGTIERLKNALVGIEDVTLLEAVNRTEGLIPAKSSDWDNLRDLAKDLGLVR